MAKKEWLDWLKCNALEVVILILVLVLLVKVFNEPAADVTVTETADQEKLPLLKNPLTGKATEEVGETSVESGELPLSETAEELPAEEVPAE